MGGIVPLALATFAFVGSHLLLSHPLRPGLVARVGEKGFLAIYVLVAWVTFIPLVWMRYTVADDRLFWVAPVWAWDLTTLLMLLASILLVGSMRGNPAMPNPGGAQGTIGDPTGVFAITRHPMLWSFILWALLHIWLWGSPANLIVAGGVLILSLAGAIGQDAKKLRLQGERWRSWMDRTAFLPFAGQISGRIPWRVIAPGWRPILIGTVIWLLASWAHPLLGGPEVGIWRWIG
ncbi:MAG: NnrU family protein [Sphingomonadaceae bacterium]